MSKTPANTSVYPTIPARYVTPFQQHLLELAGFTFHREGDRWVISAATQPLDEVTIDPARVVGGSDPMDRELWVLNSIHGAIPWPMVFKAILETAPESDISEIISSTLGNTKPGDLPQVTLVRITRECAIEIGVADILGTLRRRSDVLDSLKKRLDALHRRLDEARSKGLLGPFEDVAEHLTARPTDQRLH